MYLSNCLCFQETSQHDVQELNRILFSALESSLVGTSGSNLIHRLYHGTLVNQIVCKECSNVSERQVCVMTMHDAVKHETFVATLHLCDVHMHCSLQDIYRFQNGILLYYMLHTLIGLLLFYFGKMSTILQVFTEYLYIMKYSHNFSIQLDVCAQFSQTSKHSLKIK